MFRLCNSVYCLKELQNIQAEIVNHFENSKWMMAVKGECQKHFFFAFYAVGIKSVAIYVQLKITFDIELFSIFTNLIYFSF